MTDLREINALIDRIRDAGLRSKRHALAQDLRHAVSALDAAEGRVTVKPLIADDRHEDDWIAANTRVVTVAALERWSTGWVVIRTHADEIRAIIDNATPAPSDKIAEAARDVTVKAAQLKAISLALAKITGRDAVDEAALDSLAAEIRSLRALAGKGE